MEYTFTYDELSIISTGLECLLEIDKKVKKDNIKLYKRTYDKLERLKNEEYVQPIHTKAELRCLYAALEYQLIYFNEDLAGGVTYDVNEDINICTSAMEKIKEYMAYKGE